MKVVLAEKPTVARDIARVLGCREKHDGYLAGNGYAVTWAFGHLVATSEPQEMDPAWARPWRKDQLPMIPAPWKYRVTKDGKQQFAVIKSLFNDSQTTEIVVATDAGREGEHIFRLIYELAKCRKASKRLWISSLTDEAIREGFRSLKPSSTFDSLAAAAKARAQADWLVGLNFTRAYTVHNRQLCTIGRVQTPTLALVVNRHREIESFVSKDYYEVHVVLEPGFTARYVKDGKPRLDDKSLAERIVADVAPVAAAVATSVETKETRTNAPPLFDLLSLQKEANKRFGYTAAQTLEVAQSLYETQKLISYPRTESRHLSHDIVPALAGILEVLASVYPDIVPAAKAGFAARPLSRTYVDDTKLTDHHAIIPTNKSPQGLPLSADEQKLYDLISRRFLAIFLPPLVRDETVALFGLGPHTFRARGILIKEEGWTIAAPAVVKAPQEQADPQDEQNVEEEPEAQLPLITEGAYYPKRSQELVTRATKPPPRYTDASLLDAMKKAGGLVDDKDLAAYMKASGLGTPATRAEIIERLIKTAYLERRKKTLVPTQKGIAIVAQVHPDLKDPVLTARWEQCLKEIEEGSSSADRFQDDMVAYLKALLPLVEAAPAMSQPETTAIAPCPMCKIGVVRETQRAFGCSRWKEGCPFTIWKKIAGKKLTASLVQELLVRKRTARTLKGFTSKAGKKFDAALALDENFKVKFVFPEPTRPGGTV